MSQYHFFLSIRWKSIVQCCFSNVALTFVWAQTIETFVRISTFVFNRENSPFWMNYPFNSGGSEFNLQLKIKICQEMYVQIWQSLNYSTLMKWNLPLLLVWCSRKSIPLTHTQLPPPTTATPCQVRSSGRPWASPAKGSCCANISVSLNGSLRCCLFGLASCFYQNQYVAQEWESNDWNARLSIGIMHQSVLTWRGCVDIGVVERIG